MSAVVQLPRRIQMTLGGGPHTKLTWWKSESFDTMVRLCSRAYVQIAASVGPGQADIADMDGPREYVGKVGDEAWGQVLVEKEAHPGGIDTSLRSRSAANESAARMSSRSKSGKSARISASVIPDAK